MQKIVPYLWFDNSAQEAVDLYKSIFSNSKIPQMSRYEEENGNVMSVEFELEGQNL